MPTHPIDDLLADGLAPIKGDLRDHFRRVFDAPDLNAIYTTDLTDVDRIDVNIEVDGVVTARSFAHDPDAGGLPPVGGVLGVTYVEDDVGNIFVWKKPSASELSAALLNSVFGPGGLSLSVMPGAGDKTYLGRRSGAWAERSVSTIIGDLDGEIGGDFWRKNDAALVAGSSVAALAINIRTQGGNTRAVLLADGSVAVTGAASGTLATGDVTGGNLGRFWRLACADGVQRKFVKVWSGTDTVFAKAEDGVLFAVGQNSNGELGLGNTTDQATLQKVQYFIDNALVVEDVVPTPAGSASRGTFFRTTDGKLYFSGGNSAGEAGDGTTTQRTAPVRCGTLTSVTAVWISPGISSLVRVSVYCLAGGTLYAWGYNGEGELGLGDTTNRTAPVSTGLTNVVKVAAGNTSFALKSDGTLWVTGSGDWGGTGLGSNTDVTTWTQISSLGTTVLDVAVSEGNFATAAAIVTVGGTGRHLRTWGYNGYGSVVDGTTTNRNTPQTPSGAWQGSVDEVRFYGGTEHGSGIVIRVGNRLLGAGYNGFANLSVGHATTPVTAFTDVLGLRGTIQEWRGCGVSNGWGLLVRTDAACLSGGYNASGQTGTHETSLKTYVAILQDVLISGIIRGLKGDTGEDFKIDQIDLIANRPAANSVPEGFIFMSTDETFSGNTVAKIYRATSGVWSAAALAFQGREIELQKTATHIQWRYVGAASWSDLVPLADIKGDQGVPGRSAGFSYTWLTNNSATDPTAGKVKGNQPAFADITELYISETDANGASIIAMLGAIDNSTSVEKARVEVYDPAAPSNRFTFIVDLASVDEGTWWRLKGSVADPQGSFANNTPIYLLPVPKGDRGDDGIDGIDFEPDEVVATHADLATFDGEPKGFAVLVEADESKDGEAYLYFKLSNTSGDWSNGVRFGAASGAGGSGLLKCRTIAIDNVTIATALEAGDTLNGVTLAEGDVVLLAAQTTAAQNGPYVVPASGAASRHPDYADFDAIAGSYFAVLEGTARADTLWRCTANFGGTLGTTALPFEEVGGNLIDFGLFTGAVDGGDDYGSFA